MRCRSRPDLPVTPRRSWACVGDGSFVAPNLITLAPNQSATCTIANDDQPASLTLVKSLPNNTGPGTDANFTLTATGSPSSLSGTSGVSGPVNAGTYTLTESFSILNYEQTGLACDTVTPGGPNGNQITLANGQSATCTFTNTVIPASLSIDKTASVPGGTADADGEVISYSIAVANTSQATLTSVQVTDSFVSNLARVADTVGDNDNLLEPGDIWAYTASHTVSQGEIDAGGSIDNTASVVSDQTTTQQDTASVPIVQTPILTLDKSASPTSLSAPGTVNYSFVVTNTGNVTLTGVGVDDPAAGSDGHVVPRDDLAPLASTTCTATLEVDQEMIDAGADIVNSATASSMEGASDTDGATVTIDATAELTIAKDTTVSSVSAANTSIPYTIVVTNTGDVTLTNVTLADPFATSAVTCDQALPGTLAPAAVLSCTASHLVTQGEIDAGTALVNVATVSTNQTEPQDDDATTAIDAAAELTIAKDTTVSSVSAANTNIPYTIVVTNTGDVTLTNVTLADPFATGLSCDQTLPGTLAPAAVLSCTASHLVAQGEIDAGTALVNVATVSTNQTEPQDDDATTAIDANSALSIIKSADVTSISSDGDVIGYTIRSRTKATPV